jgi:hypothetical protein
MAMADEHQAQLLEERLGALLEALSEVLLVFGPGECPEPGCAGCQYELQEAKAILQAAYGAYHERICSVCSGERFIAADPDDDVDFTVCLHCHGNGVDPGFDIYHSLLTQLDVGPGHPQLQQDHSASPLAKDVI